MDTPILFNQNKVGCESSSESEFVPSSLEVPFDVFLASTSNSTTTDSSVFVDPTTFSVFGCFWSLPLTVFLVDESIFIPFSLESESLSPASKSSAATEEFTGGASTVEFGDA